MKPQSSCLAAAAMLAACSAAPEGGRECPAGKCDSVVGESSKLLECESEDDFETSDGKLGCTPCGDVLRDESGRGFLPRFIESDALMAKVYMTFEDSNENGRVDPAEVDCPVDLPAIMAKLDRTDAQDCRGVRTHVISETAALIGAEGSNYRTVTARDCDDRGQHGLLFSSFGFTGRDNSAGTGISQSAAPAQVEVIAFDAADGVFNFYKEVDGKMRFFGSSLDFVVAGPGGPNLTSTRGCANCHPGGGLNMKELVSPWTHWAQPDNIVGAEELVANRAAYMGTLSAGPQMENITRAGNTEWNETKSRFLRNIPTDELERLRSQFSDDNLSAAQEQDLVARGLRKRLNATQALLEPLFCPIQINIAANGKSGIPRMLFFKDHSLISGTTSEDFDQAIAAIGSEVPGTGVAVTTTPFLIATRSEEDEQYVLDHLLGSGIIDRELKNDIQDVDVTRPVFSDDRCSLLELVPDLPPSKRNAADLRVALLDALQGATPGTPAAELLANLQTTGTHGALVGRVSQACRERNPRELLRDALKLRSLQRKLLFADGALDDADGSAQHRFAVFEFPQTMPRDGVRVTTSADPNAVDEVHPDARASPVDCTLVHEFVPVAESSPE